MTELTEAMRQTLAEYPVGGVEIIGKNLDSQQQITQFLDDLQQASDTPLFTAIDEEGGLVARLANNAAFDLPQYESAAAVGTSGNPEDARAMGRTPTPITRSSVPARSAVNHRPPPTLWAGRAPGLPMRALPAPSSISPAMAIPARIPTLAP